MSLTRFLIAKLARVDEDFAGRAISTAHAQDELNTSPPREFARGAGAMAYALALFIHRKPVHFYVGLTGLIIFPLYMLGRIAAFLVEWGVHHYGG
ncbi:hypothetical protein SAMN05443245_7532 [Paraburkholderia fungorum]|uniref:Uncharacterized protein n=1 Tax=Paraburkholderia fungorum TaxID=134537 RepID=A0A1H1JYN7_9BURK|nr:hypothetical protein [Paraburkholderia fungorum]SDR54890.1 hypothetical protein SAMN05443245_7532 [Paraburkholderia fungorum]